MINKGDASVGVGSVNRRWERLNEFTEASLARLPGLITLRQFEGALANARLESLIGSSDDSDVGPLLVASPQDVVGKAEENAHHYETRARKSVPKISQRNGVLWPEKKIPDKTGRYGGGEQTGAWSTDPGTQENCRIEEEPR